jgi:hypothetical protein
MFKKQKQKIHNTSQNTISVLSNFSTTMCHVFICDKTLIPPLLNFDLESLGEGAPTI